MNIRIKNFKEYPFRGTFFSIGIDMDKPPLEQVEEKIVILDTECDIQEASHTKGELITADYTVYFPMIEDLGEIKNGVLFEGDMMKECSILKEKLPEEGKLMVRRYGGPVERLEAVAKVAIEEGCGFFFF